MKRDSRQQADEFPVASFIQTGTAGKLAMSNRIAIMLANVSVQQPTRPVAQQRPQEEPSIHGTWVGYWTVAGSKVKIISTLRADGSYKTVSEYGNEVSAELGKYTYKDGILTTEPEGGLISIYTVKFDDKDTITVKGRGIVIVLKRQRTRWKLR